jgi:DNA-binding NarL/FixJ family response regulator
MEARVEREPAEPDVLSPRERDVVVLVADGRTNEQIARLLGVSLSTIKAELSTIFAKLGATDRASAVAACFRRGLLR